MRLALLALLTLIAAGPAPATKPTSRPATPPKQHCTLVNGAVRFVVPADFKEVGRGDDDKQAIYDGPDGTCRLQLIISPQEMGFPAHNDKAVEQLKTTILQGIRQRMKQQNLEVLYGPRSETDDRFLLRIHDRFRQDGQVYDEVQTYRAAGIDILMVLTLVKSEDPKEIKRWDEVGEDVCLSLQVGSAPRKSTGAHNK